MLGYRAIPQKFRKLTDGELDLLRKELRYALGTLRQNAEDFVLARELRDAQLCLAVEQHSRRAPVPRR